MIIITGASKGIGQYLFNSFFEKSDETVLGTYLSTKPDKHLEYFVHLDVCDWVQVNKFISEKEPSLSDITLINCAGISYTTYTHKSDPESWKRVIETNLIGTYHFIRSLLPIMRKQNFGRIINLSSVVAVKPTPGISAYAASKSALWGMAKSLAVENASLNITINNINMGYSELGMINSVPDEFKKKIIAEIPAGMLCEPKDILKTVQYLRETRYINGASLDLSGGLV